MTATKSAGPDALPGWFWPSDVTLFRWFLSHQVAAGEVGDLAELGPFMGKSAVVIGDYVQPNEVFTVIDLFEQPAADAANQAENESTYGGFSQAAFEASYRSVHERLPVVVKGYSQSITEHARHGAHRWVHIDASHLYEHVRGDIAAVRQLLSPTGIVVFDDIRAYHAPGVWAAVWEAVVTEGLQPIIVSEHKMYATYADPGAWQQRLLADPPSPVVLEEQSVLGRPLLRGWTPGLIAGVPPGAVQAPSALRDVLRRVASRVRR